MRYLELRRHSLRLQGTEHLSQAGVTRARQVGEGMGPFALVVASPSAWTRETAIAMGFAVDEFYQPVPLTEDEWSALGRLMPPETPLAACAAVLRDDPLGRRYAALLHEQWASIARRLPDGACALIVTHGGYIDCSAAACLPDALFAEWGADFDRAEGFRMAWDGERFRDGVPLRL